MRRIRFFFDRSIRHARRCRMAGDVTSRPRPAILATEQKDVFHQSCQCPSVALSSRPAQKDPQTLNSSRAQGCRVQAVARGRQGFATGRRPEHASGDEAGQEEEARWTDVLQTAAAPAIQPEFSLMHRRLQAQRSAYCGCSVVKRGKTAQAPRPYAPTAAAWKKGER